MKEKMHDLKIKEKELETKIIDLIKKDDLTLEENNLLQECKKELKNVSNELKEINNSLQNWSCSYSYKLKDGKVEKQFLINDKEVNEEEYRKFVGKKNLLYKRQNQISSFGKMVDYLFTHYDEDDLFSNLLTW